jgi:hypothetical protein
VLELTRYITYNFSSLGSVVVVYKALIRSKLEYATVVLYNITSTECNKIENIQRKFVGLYCFLFFQIYFLCNYDFILSCLNFRTFYSRRHCMLHFLSAFPRTE